MKTDITKQLIQGLPKHSSPRELLIQVLEASIELVSLPDNDFSWSSWADEDAAKTELELLLHSLRAGALPDKLHIAVLFAPTGPLQELSLSSGWANTFLKVAAKFDEAEARLW